MISQQDRQKRHLRYCIFVTIWRKYKSAGDCLNSNYLSTNCITTNKLWASFLTFPSVEKLPSVSLFNNVKRVLYKCNLLWTNSHRQIHHNTGNRAETPSYVCGQLIPCCLHSPGYGWPHWYFANSSCFFSDGLLCGVF